MKFYLKGFYGYKNFGDEMLFFGLLNYLQKEYNPEIIIVEVGNKQRIQDWAKQNKSFLDTGVLDKLDFIENAENSVIVRRFNQILSILGVDKYKKYFKVFGGGEVLDESRPFPHNGRNLPILHRYAIRKKHFILVGGVGCDQQKSTKYLYKYLLPKAQKTICRESTSVQRVQNYIKNKSKILLVDDFSHEILLNTPAVIANLGSNPYDDNEKNRLLRTSQGQEYIKNKTILINISPKYFAPQNINKIKKYISKFDAKTQKIFFPSDINYDKPFYSQLRKTIPDLEIYDRTKHPLSETINLFKNCSGGVGSRLHFLYPLKVFKKDFVSISDSDKVKKMIY